MVYCKKHFIYINGLKAKIFHAKQGCTFMRKLLQTTYEKNYIENAEYDHKQQKERF